MTEILLVSTSSKHSLTHNFLLSKFLLKSLFTKGPPAHTQNVYWFLNFKSFFLEFSFPNKLPTLCLPLKCQAVTQNTKATGLVLPGCGCNARCRSSPGCGDPGARLRWKPQALAPGGRARGTEVESAKRPERSSASSSSSPTPKAERKEQINTWPEWKQRVSDRKQLHHRADEAQGTGNAAQLSLR